MFRAGWQLAAATVLLVLLPVLATLQYRWLGELSAAERERMRAGLQARVTAFTTAFDSEITRTYAAFQVDDLGLARDAGGTLAEAFQRWRQQAVAPDLIQAVYLLAVPPEAVDGGLRPDGLRQLNPETGALAPAPWPEELRRWRDTATSVAVNRDVPPGLPLPQALDAEVPALMVIIPRAPSATDRPSLLDPETGPFPGSVVIVLLDRDQLQRELLATLAVNAFGSGPDAPYLATVIQRDAPHRIIFSSEPAAPVEAAPAAESVSGLFSLQMDDLPRLAESRPHAARDRVAIAILRKTQAPDGPRRLWLGAAGPAAWELRVRHRAGSLETIVAESRRRNLVMSLGVLGLLGVSIAMVITGARRQHELSRQQMEFVAAVSHELRTPLAVICSAGENLADGVASDPAQVRTYGRLIGTEGRRLASMVERVMEFAGISAGVAASAAASVNLAAVVDEAVMDVRREYPGDAVAIRVAPVDPGLSVDGDKDALRSAVRNILGNAVKHSPEGAEVAVSAEARGGVLHLRVADQGMGIDTDDVPHLFKPFFRGRRAMAAQVRGSGIGLSVVRHVVDAHKGQIGINSSPGHGTIVIVELPLATAAAASAPEAQV